MNQELEVPKYIKIALDIAYRIHNDEFKEGSKVRGRSTLAGEYNVSPETIRRAVALLHDMKVVRVIQKSGIFIESKENAHSFIQNFSLKKDISALNSNIKNLIDQKIEIEKKIQEDINAIIEYSTQLRNVGLIYPFELKVPSHSHIVGKTVADTMFWHHTGATIIGVRRDEQLMISPGPYLSFEIDDMILFVGNNDTLDKVKRYIDLQKNNIQK